jgi:hypothetical protein
MNGHFSQFQKRSLAQANHRISLLNKARKRRMLYFGEKEPSEDFDFSKMSDDELIQFKRKTRAKAKIKNRIIWIITILISIPIIYYYLKLTDSI